MGSSGKQRNRCRYSVLVAYNTKQCWKSSCWRRSESLDVWRAGGGGLTCHYRGTYLYLAYEMAQEPMTCFSLVHATPNDTMVGWCSHWTP